jgi:hypothetical protein
MSNNVDYKYDSINGIMYKIHYGDIDIEIIKNSWEWAYSNKIIPENTSKFILDYREASLIINPRNAEEISNYYINNPKYFAGKKFAIISDDPKNVVISTLVRKKDEGYDSKPFSTIEAAIIWLNQ